MTTSEMAGAQLVDELSAVATQLAAILGADLVELLTVRAEQAADRLIGELEDGADVDTVALDILNALWPHGDPDLSWWRTPLGLAIAPSWAARQPGGWTHSQAAEVLGVTRDTVGTLVRRGTLGRAEDGSVAIADVIARLVRLSRQR
ncbi:hypothetical protein [Polymorphospora sp. NPDC050346]|uniref:hypothetical protein n=1 Tax=Polymorphospora sp. NPDC050346 TaxID=3155780 RepID=UPI0033F094E6